MNLFGPIMLSEIAQKVNSGSSEDVDFFMSHLTRESPINIIKLVDFALSQIRSQEGVLQIKYYLFNGSEIQRSYAALYFKRHRNDQILLEAYHKKCIDKKQAFSK